MVWAHEMTCYPLHLKAHTSTEYGSLYPLALQYSDTPELQTLEAEEDIQEADAAGIDAFDVDMFTDPSSLECYLDAADAFDSALPSGQPPFLIAPTLDLSLYQIKNATDTVKEAAALAAVEQYCELAQGHPSAAMNDGEFVIFNYGTSQLPPANWLDLRQRLAADGCATYWVANLGADGLTDKPVFPTSTITQYFPEFESSFLFGNAGQWWPNLTSLMASYQRPFAGGMMPGYNREPADAYNDSNGTAQYRSHWNQHLQSNLPWIHVSTWNDMAENTDINPTSDWNITRSEITAFEADRFKGQAIPLDVPTLYITTPKALALAASSSAEALVLNPTGSACTVTIGLYDGKSNLVGKTVTAKLTGMDSSLAIPVQPYTVPAGGYLQAMATLSVGGQSFGQVLSAPILVFPASTGYFQTYLNSTPRIEYYSIPALMALPGTVKLSIKIAAGGTSATATITPPAGDTVQFVDLLHNTREVYNFGSTKPFTVALPAGRVVLGTAVTMPDTNISGYYVARVIDSYGRVGYSTPVLVP